VPRARRAWIGQTFPNDFHDPPQVRLFFGSRAPYTERPDSDLDLLVTVPDDWLAADSRFMETDALGCKLAHHRIFSSMTADLLDHVGSLLP